MALKYNVSNQLWAMDRANQRRAQQSQALGEDLGFLAGYGVSSGVSSLINKKAKKAFADEVAATPDGEDKPDWKEFRTKFKKEQGEKKLRSKLNKDKFGDTIESNYNTFLDKHAGVGTPMSQEEWLDREINQGRGADLLKEARSDNRKEFFGISDSKMSDNTWEQLHGRPHQNLSRKQKKSLLDMADNYKYEGGDSAVTAEEQALRDAEQADLLTGDLSEKDYDVYSETAPSLQKNLGGFYNTIPSESGIRGMANAIGPQQNLPYTSPLVNRNLKTGIPGFGDKGWSTVTSPRLGADEQTDVSAAEQSEYNQSLGEQEIANQVQQIMAGDPNLDVQDVLYNVLDLDSVAANRQAFIGAADEEANAKFQEEWLRRSSEPMVTTDFQDTFTDKIGRFGESVYDTFTTNPFDIEYPGGKTLRDGMLGHVLNSPNAQFYGNAGQWWDSLGDTKDMYTNLFNKNVLGYK